MRALELKPTHKPVQTYYAALRQFDDLGVTHEGAVKSAFRSLSASIGERVRVRCRSAELARRSINPKFPDAAEEIGSTGHWPVPSGDSPDGMVRRYSRQYACGLRNARCCRSGRRVADRGGRAAHATHARRNIIAAEIEKVMATLASQSFSRAEFLNKLDCFYLAIEYAAA